MFLTAGCIFDVPSSHLSRVFNTWGDNLVILWQVVSNTFLTSFTRQSYFKACLFLSSLADVQMCWCCCCQHSTSALKSNKIIMFCSGRPQLMCEHMREGEMGSEIQGDTRVCLNLFYHNFSGYSYKAIHSSHYVDEKRLSFLFVFFQSSVYSTLKVTCLLDVDLISRWLKISAEWVFSLLIYSFNNPASQAWLD